MESDQDEKPGPGSAVVIEPFKERNGETWGARVTRNLPEAPYVLPKQDVKVYRGHKNMTELLVTIGMDEEDRLAGIVDETGLLH